MSFSKYLLPIILQFFSSRINNSNLSSQTVMLNALTDTLKKEISGYILKVVFGLVATGVLIYSLVVLGQHFQTYLLLYNNGPTFSVLFFSLLAVVCVFTVFKLFYKKETSKDPFAAAASKEEKQSNIRAVYSNFMSGMVDGLREGHEEKSRHKQIDDRDYNKYSDATH